MVQSAKVLNDAIMTQNGNPTLVFGYSQSASVASLEMQHLLTLPAGQRPTADQLSFVLAANPNRPNGGFLERFHGLYIRFWICRSSRHPANAYPTTDYAIQYDFQADFPQYPLNLLADATPSPASSTSTPAILTSRPPRSLPVWCSPCRRRTP
ncbi:PE-PPE domain protein [Mycobacterium kansasii]|uniref:PE-PPE domain protein n=1 Tax=Mycobacterium kansasii TaxID=1768 RepID=A0A1V3W990_MYCKA|nr:PE-PPE domain protein [Mycobacterium kansasii]